MRRALLVGLLYLAAVQLTSATGYPVRPLYDGTAPPPPYNWVDPPPDLEEQNLEPLGGVSSITMTPEGSRARTIQTPDGQALVTVPTGAFDEEAEISITPSAPRVEPPAGLRIDGNAYTFTAKNTAGREVNPSKQVTIILRYPVHATTLLRLDGGNWDDLKARQIDVNAQVFTRVNELGTFAAAAPPEGGLPWWVPAAGLSVIAAAVAIILDRRRKKGTT